MAIDRAGNRVDPPSTPDAITTVTKTNRPPVVDPIPDQVITEGDILEIQVHAIDPDGDTLRYQLRDNAPAGMTLNPDTGLLRWVTGEGLAGTTNLIEVTVMDSGLPNMGTVVRFKVIVQDLNQAPVLEPVPDQQIREGELWKWTNVVHDVDVPAQKITFRLGPDAPEGMTIDPDTGVMSWRPSEVQGGRTYRITVIATDDGTPPQSAQITFQIAVEDVLADFRLWLGHTVVSPGEVAQLPLHVQLPTDIRSLDFNLEPGKDRITDINAVVLVPGGTVTVVPNGGVWSVSIAAPESAPVTGDLDLAQIQLSTDTNPQSAWVPIRVSDIAAHTVQGRVLTNVRARGGYIVIHGEGVVINPVLQDQGTKLEVFGKPNTRYQIQMAFEVGDQTVWIPWGEVTLDENGYGKMDFSRFGVRAAFFRLMEVQP